MPVLTRDGSTRAARVCAVRLLSSGGVAPGDAVGQAVVAATAARLHPGTLQ